MTYFSYIEEKISPGDLARVSHADPLALQLKICSRQPAFTENKSTVQISRIFFPLQRAFFLAYDSSC